MMALFAASVLLVFGTECSDFNISQGIQSSLREANLALFTLQAKYPRDELAIKEARRYHREVVDELVKVGTIAASAQTNWKLQLERMKKEKYEHALTFMHQLRQAEHHLKGLKPGDEAFEAAQTAVIQLYTQLDIAEVRFEILKRNLRSIEISRKEGILAQGWTALKSEIGVFFGYFYFVLIMQILIFLQAT